MSWAPWMEFFRDAGYDPIAPGWPGQAATVEETPTSPRSPRRPQLRRDCRPLRAVDRRPGGAAHRHRALLRRSRHRKAPRSQPGRRSRRRGRRADQGRQTGAARDVAQRISRSEEPSQQQACRFSDARAVPLRLRKRRQRTGVRCTPPAVEYPRPGQATVRGVSDELLAQLAPQGRNTQRRPRPAAADHGREGPHRSPAISRATFKQYRHSKAVTELKEFSDRGHSLTIDHGWREVAEFALKWLQGKGY